MTGTIGVAVMPRLSLVFDVGHIDGDTARLLLWRIVDLAVALALGQLAVGQDARNRRGQRGFAVIDMADGANIAVGLVAQEHFLLNGIEAARHAY